MSNESENDEEDIDEADKILYVQASDRHGNIWYETELTLETLDERIESLKKFYFEFLEENKEIILELQEMRAENDKQFASE